MAAVAPPEWVRFAHFKRMSVFSMLPQGEWDALCIAADEGDATARDRLLLEFDRYCIVQAYAGFPGGDLSAVRPAALRQSEYKRHSLPNWMKEACEARAKKERERT
jgi:hypothetical protein